MDVDAGMVGDELPQGAPGPRRGEVEGLPVHLHRGGAGGFHGGVGHQLLGQRHHLGVVGVGLVGLEHRELGVMSG